MDCVHQATHVEPVDERRLLLRRRWRRISNFNCVRSLGAYLQDESQKRILLVRNTKNTFPAGCKLGEWENIFVSVYTITSIYSHSLSSQPGENIVHITPGQVRDKMYSYSTLCTLYSIVIEMESRDIISLMNHTRPVEYCKL